MLKIKEIIIILITILFMFGCGEGNNSDSRSSDDVSGLSIYSLDVNNSDGDSSIPFEGAKQFTVSLTDHNNALVAYENISSITVSISNLGSIVDNNGNRANELVFRNQNLIIFNVESGSASTDLTLEVEAKFTDAVGEEKTLIEYMSLSVEPGPPSAISLSYVSTSLEKQEYAKFVEKWAVTVTDKYGRNVDSNPSITVGVMAGYAKDSSGSASNLDDFLYFPPSQGNGTLNAENDTFSAKANVFSNVDQTNQYLVTFGDGYTYNASGKWDIYTNNASVLELVEDYTSTTTSGLGFAVGNNFRQDKSKEASEWIANAYPEAEGNTTVPDSGNIIINVEYDYYMVGKEVMLWVNLIGKNHEDGSIVRIGEVKKETLRGNGIESNVEEYVVPGGVINASYTFLMKISDTVEWYRHANFGAMIETSEDVIVNDIVYSDTDASVANVVVTVTNTDANATGTVSISNPLVADEF